MKTETETETEALSAEVAALKVSLRLAQDRHATCEADLEANGELHEREGYSSGMADAEEAFQGVAVVCANNCELLLSRYRDVLMITDRTLLERTIKMLREMTP